LLVTGRSRQHVVRGKVASPTNESVHGIERTLAKTLVGMITRFVANATASTCGLYANSLSGRERKA
jgi:hypothetical protein